MTTARLVRSVLEVRPNRWRPGTATLLMVGVAIPIAVGLIRGETLLGVLVSIGALYAGLASFGNTHRVRLRRMALTALVVAGLSFLGCLMSTSDVATMCAVAVVAFVFSVYGATSAENSLVGLLGCGILIIVSGLHIEGFRPWEVGLFVFAGGAVQTVLVALTGPLFPRSIERRAVASTFESLARYVESLGEGSLVPDATPFDEARSRLSEGESTEHARLWHVLRVSETLRTALVGFVRSHRRVSSEGFAGAEPIREQLVRDLDDFADAVMQGRYNVLASLAARPPEVADERYARWVSLIVTAFEEAARPPVAGESPGREVAVKQWWFFDNQALKSLTLLHALRFSLGVGVATAIYRLWHIPMGYWIPLTVVFLLRPNYSTTLLRGFARFIGTFGGVVVASVCAAVLPHDPFLLSVLAVVGVWFAFSLYEVSFTLYIGALTFYVVMGLAAQGQPETTVGLERTGATALGVVLAVVATFLWPVWESSRLRPVLRDAFLAQVEYGGALDGLMHGDPVACGEELRQKARGLRVEAERLYEASQLEPRWSRKDSLEEAQERVETLVGNTAELLTLHAQALEQRAGRIPDEPRSRQRLQHAISEARLMSESLGRR